MITNNITSNTVTQGTIAYSTPTNYISGSLEDNIISGTVLSVNKDNQLVCRKAVKINGVLKYLDEGEIQRRWERLPQDLAIRTIGYCDEPGKEKVIVVFADGEKVVTKPSHNDEFDLKIGVALAFMIKVCGSKTQFGKMIQQKTAKKK